MTNHPNRSKASTAARRAAKILNAKRGQGGFCVFAADGSGGYWYSANSFPSLSDGEFRVSVPDSHITAAEVDERLEQYAA